MFLPTATFAALALTAAPMQDEADDPDPWPLDMTHIQAGYEVSKPYLEGEKARCDRERPGSTDCLTILWRHYLIALIDGNYVDAVTAADNWLEEAGSVGMLGTDSEYVMRYRLAYAANRAATSGLVFPRPTFEVAVDQLIQAIKLAKTFPDAGPWIVSMRRERARATRGLAIDEMNPERRARFWQMSALDLREAIAKASTFSDDFNARDLGDMNSNLARSLFERGIKEEAALAAEQALAHYRRALAEDPDAAYGISRDIKGLAVQTYEAGQFGLAIDYYNLVLDLVVQDIGVVFTVGDVLGMTGAQIANGRPDIAVQMLDVALQDPNYIARASNAAFLRGRLLRALVANREYDRIPSAAREAIAFGEAKIAEGEYDAPIRAMMMHARAAWGQALAEQGRWSEAEPLLRQSRDYRVQMAFTDPTEADEINGDLLLAKAISRGSGDYALARSLLLRGMEASLISAQRDNGFGEASQTALRAFAPVFREQVRIAFALAEQDGEPVAFR